jgi:hypothetical protein
LAQPLKLWTNGLQTFDVRMSASNSRRFFIIKLLVSFSPSILARSHDMVFQFHPASIAGRRFCACDRRRFPICIVHLFPTALHSHAHSMLRRAPFCQLLTRLLPPLPLHQPRPWSLHLSPLLLLLQLLTQHFSQLNLNLRKALSVLSASKKTPSLRPSR